MRQPWAEAAEVMSESYFADSATHRLSPFLQEGEWTFSLFFLIALFLAQWDLVAKKHLTSVISLSLARTSLLYFPASDKEMHILQDVSVMLLTRVTAVLTASWRIFHFVSAGCSVVIASRKFDRLKATAEELNNAFSSVSPAKVTPLQCNIRKEEEVTTSDLVLGFNMSKVYHVYKFSDLQIHLWPSQEYSRCSKNLLNWSR